VSGSSFHSVGMFGETRALCLYLGELVQVLDLMVRMLGFTEEDKQRVGLAQQTATKGGVVRGVFSLPGRFVGGLLGSGGDASPRAAPSDNQVSFCSPSSPLDESPSSSLSESVKKRGN